MPLRRFIHAPMREIDAIPHYLAQLSVAPAVKAIISFLAGTVTFLFPDPPAARDGVMLLMLMMLLDAMTGCAASIKENVRVSSAGLYRTAVKILVYGSIVMVAAIIGKLLFADEAMRKVLISLVTAWAVLTEAISVLENITRMGFPLPSFLMNVLKWEKASVEHKGDAFKHKEE